MPNAFVGSTASSAFVGNSNIGGKVAPAIPAATTPAISSTVAQILGFTAQNQTDTANAAAASEQAKAAEAQAAGYTAEAGAYDTASTIAAVAGNITELQTARQVSGTVGAQQSGVAAAGFKNAGSSVDVLRSSLQQGYLQQQILETQTAQEQQAYLAQSSGAKAAAVAATAAAGGATAESNAFTKAGELAAGTAASETTALNQFLGGAKLTPEQQLTLAPLTGNADVGSLLTALQPGGAGNPTVINGSTVQSSSYGTASGYPVNSSVQIGGKTFATDGQGRVVVV